MTPVIRALQVSDYDRGYLQLLGQLTTVGSISKQAFEGRFQELDRSPDYHVLVAQDANTGNLLGTATLMVERKFIHECGKIGHIEDVVVDAAARGLRLGQKLVEELLLVAQQQGCYKAILDCAESNAGFYEKCGMQRKEVQMVKYFDR